MLTLLTAFAIMLVGIWIFVPGGRWLILWSGRRYVAVLRRWWRSRKEPRPVRFVVGLVLAVFVVGVLAVGYAKTVLALLIIAAVLALYFRLRTTPEKDDPDAWWRARFLGDALVGAGITKPPPAGQGHHIRYLGRPQQDEHGVTVTIDLPGDALASTAMLKREALARCLRVNLDRFDVSPVEGTHPGVVRLWVGEADATPQTVAATVPARSTWPAPVRIGANKRGAPVMLPTHEANTLVAGVMGYGKTSTARILVGHALLDPASRLWVIDGKGSTKDWGDARPVAERFVLGSAEDAVEQTQAALDEVLAEVRRRNAASATDPKTDALLLLLDEWQDVRASADKAQREALDATLGRIIRTGRAVGSHVVIVTQRPTVEDVPSGARNLLSNRLALVTRNAADAALVLGEQPTLALPKRKGEALLATPTGMSAVRLDYLSDEQWRDLCRRAAALRPRRAPEPAPSSVRVEDTPSPSLDPEVEAIVAVLRDAPDGMTAGEILKARGLPSEPKDAAALGRFIRRHPDLFLAPQGERGKVGGRRLIRLEAP